MQTDFVKLLKGHCHESFVKHEKQKENYVLISDNLQTMILFRIKVVYKWLKQLIVDVGQG